MKNIKTYEEYKGQTFKEFMSKNYFALNICDIRLASQKLIDFNGIQEFVNLTKIYAHNNNLTNLLELEKLENLTYLDITNNKLTSLKGIENLTKLDSLFCHNNDKLDSLDFIPNSLFVLSYSNNKLTSLKGIGNLTNLENLYCDYNSITSLKPILNLTKLKTLYCEGNPIDWVDYIDKQGNKWYIVLPKSIESLISDKFNSIREYLYFMDNNQPAGVSRKFNF